jgi:rod shape determining protein RodA
MIRTAGRSFSPSQPDSVRGTDVGLLLSALFLLLFGLAALYSIDHARDTGWFGKQIFLACLGIVPFLVFNRLPAQFWQRVATPLYIVNLVLLVGVLIVGVSVGGAQRWLNIGPIQFQPSEFSKIALAMTLGAFYAARLEDIKRPSTFVLSILHLLPPLLLVFKQPHLGGTLTLVGIWFVVTVVAGVPWRFIGVAVLAGAVIGAVGWNVPGVLTPEQKSRVVGFLNPDPDGAGYQQTRALVALGSGGAFGRGYLRGDVKANGSVPEQQTDFIFSVIGEEGGLFGVLLLMVAFAFFFYRCWVASFRAVEPFRRLAGAGILAALAFHFFANIGMNLMVLPVVGLWLPFVSYGGTALWMCMAAVGFFASNR